MAPLQDTNEMRCAGINIWLDDAGFISDQSTGWLLGLTPMRKQPNESPWLVTLRESIERLGSRPDRQPGTTATTIVSDATPSPSRRRPACFSNPPADLEDRALENAAGDARI